ncbi:MAG: hypothetical protein OEW60_08960, partial [Thiovulaceae bacterium]|nr:hypothetical protein [Sulfurimonadaceae bacterium]
MRKLMIFSLLATSLLAKSYLSSPIAVPKNRIFNLDVEKCSTHCLSKLLKSEQIFSFVSHMDDQSIDAKLKENMMIYASYFNLDRVTYETHFRVALLIPNKIIGKYAVSTNNAVFAYLLAKNRSFDLQTYYIDDESQETIDEALEKIMDDGFSYAIAPLTLKGATAVAKHGPSLLVYFPTIHKHDIP